MQFTRAELYEKVWTEAVTRVAKSVGLSDRGLGKLCARHDIPVPPRGYWARRSAGYTGAKPSLPVGKRSADEVIRVEPQLSAHRVASRPRATASEGRQEELIAVRTGPPRHHLVRLTATALRGGTADQYGRRWGGAGVLDVRVSQASIIRALAILDALLLAAEGRGHKVSVKDRMSVLTVDGESVEFGLDERSVQKERPLTEKEKLELARGGYVYGRYSYVSCGELSFHLRCAYWSRNKWSDRKKVKLEDQLNDILAGVAAAGMVSRQQRLERDKREAESRRQEELRQQERERIRQLDEWSKRWEQCERYRAFLDALKTRFEHESKSPELATWFSWANAYVSQIDPLTDAPSEAPDEK